MSKQPALPFAEFSAPWAQPQSADDRPEHVKQRDRAVKRVSRRAEDACERFSERVAEFVVNYLKQHGPTPGEVLTDRCKEAGIKPHDDRAFGGVYLSLSRRKVIERCGSALRKKGHGTTGGSVWRLVAEKY